MMKSRWIRILTVTGITGVMGISVTAWAVGNNGIPCRELFSFENTTEKAVVHMGMEAINETEPGKEPETTDTCNPSEVQTTELYKNTGISGETSSDTAERIVTENTSGFSDEKNEEINGVSDKEISTQRQSVSSEDMDTSLDLQSLSQEQQVQKKGMSYYLNLKRYEALAEIYSKMDKLMEKKTELYRIMYENGQITEVQVKQAEADKAETASQEEKCRNQMAYYQFCLKDISFSGENISIKEQKSLGDIETCVSAHKELDAVYVAGCVTANKNAVSDIKAKTVEKEVCTALWKQTQLLEQSGEASKLDVINSELNVLKAELELEACYYDMNAAYYFVI